MHRDRVKGGLIEEYVFIGLQFFDVFQLTLGVSTECNESVFDSLKDGRVLMSVVD